MSATVYLRPGHVQPVWMGHPWVYAQAIGRIEGDAEHGDEVEVRDPRGNTLGRGYYSPGSAIPVRLLTRDAGQRLDGAFLSRRIGEAARWRRELLGLPSEHTTALRVVNSEGDGLPGLIVDRFGDAACAQLLTAGMKRREGFVFEALRSHLGVRRIYEVASAKHQALEGVEATEGLRWSADGSDGPLRFRENGIDIEVTAPGDEGGGQKTGYYLDQRDNRAMIAALSKGARVLDLYTHTGGFALAALKAGAKEVVGVDSSAPAIASARAIASANGLSAARFIKGDARKVLGDHDAAGPLRRRGVRPAQARRPREGGYDAFQHYRRTNALAAARVEDRWPLPHLLVLGERDRRRAPARGGGGARDAGRDLIVLRTTGAKRGRPPVPRGLRRGPLPQVRAREGGVRPVDEISPAQWRSLAGVATDLDDTLTHHGALTTAALRALHDLADANLPCVVATGRTLGLGADAPATPPGARGGDREQRRGLMAGRLSRRDGVHPR
ncbi:MAG: class I SAM-dependent methyltransferase [Polyangiales bacterium]